MERKKQDKNLLVEEQLGGAGLSAEMISTAKLSSEEKEGGRGSLEQMFPSKWVNTSLGSKEQSGEVPSISDVQSLRSCFLLIPQICLLPNF